ncbi:hypothetical protein BCR37DRAFT_378501 [Protomyces lactucae-debilis]|uniref:Pentacotripeptide-repeat region of PRORP domain-containing protein n=1 Tax=Protomyces lactucae-debilis TaxID=2754530 RepID=A0A1Y2FKI6_PROLT|nr:uncharacterized protein BCR37DRAFT_378501 [Protomyces lactucae-debilis]ORY84468.1 hypothetical protein BCR37DRAFT_378501 [Protomyces lactucae-debilis]
MYRLPRFLCPALSRTIPTRRPPARPLLLQNIDKLESYVKSLEKKVQKQAVAAKKAAEPEEIDQESALAMYASLADKAQTAQPTAAQLPATLRTTMQLAESADLKTVDWGRAVSHLISSDDAARLSTSDLNGILLAMPARARLSAGERLLAVTTCRRDNLSYDLMMDAHASLSQVPQALAAFDALQKAGLTPTRYSYAHLMKAFAKTSDVERAAALYKHMQARGIEANLVTITTLINCCIRAGKTERAFSIFDALKYRAANTAPDIHTYTLMIHACAKDKTQSAERASELFEELAERGLQPTRATFNALIHVYATRRDYFAQAWKMAELMKSNQVDLDKTTWHSLLAACAMNKDLTRARKLVRELEVIGKQQPLWAPDEKTYQLLFRTYAGATVKKSRVAIDEATLGDEGDAQSLVQKGLAVEWIEQMPFTSNDVLEESRRVMAYLQQLHPESLSTQLIDTYLTIAIPYKASKRFIQDWQTLYANLERSRFSFQIALQAAYAFRDSAFLNQVWAERTAWLANTANKHLRHDQEATKLYIEALARCDRLEEAVDILADARTHYQFTKPDLRCFQTKAMQLANEDAVLLYNTMFPPNSRHEVHRGRF